MGSDNGAAVNANASSERVVAKPVDAEPVDAQPVAVERVVAGRIMAGLVEANYTPAEPIDVHRTLAVHRRGSFDPTARVTAAGFWLTLLTPLGPATLLISQQGATISARSWGDGAAWAIDGVPGLLGFDDDWSALDLAGSPALAEVLRRAPGLRLSRTGLVMAALVPAIIEQKVTTVEAHRAWYSLVRRYGTPAPGPAPSGMYVTAAPSTWSRIPSWDWHRVGVDPRRSRTVLSACSVASGLERATSASDGARRVQTVSGVGRWTAAETTQRSHADPDSVSVGDYHLAAQVGWALTGSAVDDEGMLELLEPWAGNRQRIVRLILESGHRKPRRGPRLTIQDHRNH